MDECDRCEREQHDVIGRRRDNEIKYSYASDGFTWRYLEVAEGINDPRGECRDVKENAGCDKPAV